ncbi:uncharacterized protein HaLaN_13261 [Haematococcus lacustris]|uniref:Uncharacterized protein n=1 Tax=Haematococcus lacustris TaxID=44745 RepID=A0A699Z5E6_HAELA|nr:uncharacterized protein HaLaN_13261 [Haematococcus lacustris]
MRVARLERVWNLLLMPLTARLDMVLAYTARERANQFETALEAWERAAVAVVAREELLAGLTALQLGVEDGSIAHVSVTAVERQCVALAQVTAYVQRCREALVGSELTYEGLPYPGEAVVTQAHMLAFMEWLRDESPPSLRLTT